MEINRKLRGKYPEVSSHTHLKQETVLEYFCCGWLFRFTFCSNKYNYSCVLYVYCLGQPNLHSCCELDSETLVGVTCGELLAI